MPQESKSHWKCISTEMAKSLGLVTLYPSQIISSKNKIMEAQVKCWLQS